MGAKMEESKSESLKIRLTPTTREACKSARLSGSWNGRTEADFLAYLIELGMVRYKRSILPIERGEDLDAPMANHEKLA